MAIPKKYKLLVKRVLWVFIPAVVVFAAGVGLLELYVAYTLTRPAKTKLYGSPHDFQIILQQQPMWFDEKWRDTDGSQSVGWLLTHEHSSPTIVLSHAYNSNRSELLTLSFELWKAGYNVLLYDLRGHGESPVLWSGLGTYEVDDLIAGINYLKGLKAGDGSPLLDDRIGLYGVELGGYASLMAAGESPLVKAVAVDSVYPDIRYYINYRIKAFVGTNSSLTRLIDSPSVDNLTNTSMHLYLMRTEETKTAVQSLKSPSDRKYLFVVGQDSGMLTKPTQVLYQQCASEKQFIQVSKSRISRLYEKDSADYDAQIVAFFKDSLPVADAIPEKGTRASR
ncbi:MAG TPA: alpha/beta fold hydrolase [Blastocatellia bacterium]|nr:alpha/beta fold hydrolase [Blastocatellia bacterium]